MNLLLVAVNIIITVNVVTRKYKEEVCSQIILSDVTQNISIDGLEPQLGDNPELYPCKSPV